MTHRFYTFILVVCLAACGPSGSPITDGPFVQMDNDGEPVVVWSTAESAPSEVSYGLATDLNIVARVSGERTDHRVRLPSTKRGTVYSYQVAARHDVETFLSGVRFTRPPYLQNVSSTGATILWGTNTAGPGVAVFSTMDTVFSVSEKAPGRVRVDGLSPGKTYTYRVVVEGVSSEPGRLTAASADEQTLSVALFGDSRDNPDVVGRLAEQMRSWNPDLVLHSGDFVVDARNPEEWDPQFFQPASILLRDVPVYPAIGNHEHDDPSYYDAFEVPENGSSRGEAWYSIRRGPMHLTVLDTNPVSGLFEPGTDQLAWLENDLGNADAPWKIVMFHHPLYSSGRHKSNLDLRGKLMPLFRKHGVRLLLTGHDHCYERTWPLQGDRRNEEGIVHVVSGGGGAVLYPVSRSDWTAVSESVFHACQLRISPERIDVDVFDLDGKEVDAFSIAKADAAERDVRAVASSPSPEAIRALGRLSDRRHLEVIERYAGDSDVERRRAVAEALSRIGSPGALSTLNALVADTDTKVRRWATRGLAYIDAPASSSPLVARLSDPDVETRRFAAIGLRLVPLEGAADALVEASQDPQVEVRLAAVQALRYYSGNEPVSAIIARLQDSEPEVRSMAISAIVELGIASRAVEPLARILPDQTDDEKIRILQLLGGTKDAGAVDAMTVALTSPSTSVRRRAAIELANLGRRESVSALITALEDPDKGVRQFAWRALRVITGERHPANVEAWRTWSQKQ